MPKPSSFLGRHHQLLTVIGALIVFLTFVVNDLFREKHRDLADAIDRAEGTFMLRADIHYGNVRLERIKELINVIRDETLQERGERQPPTGEEIESVLNDMYRRDLGQSSAVLDTISRLIERVPSNSELLGQVETLKKDIELARKTIDDKAALSAQMDSGDEGKIAELSKKVWDDERTSKLVRQKLELPLPFEIDKLATKSLDRAVKSARSMRHGLTFGST